MARRKASIRFWQTGLFVVVIVVAMLILSGSLSAGLQATLTEMAKAAEVRNTSALARRLEPEFPFSTESRERIAEVLVEYRSIYGAGIWVYDRTGTLIESSYDTSPSDTALAEARDTALAGTAPYATTDLRPNGWTVAARTVLGPTGEREGVIVLASPVDDSLRILDAVRDRIWVTFWISLVIAGLLGFAFSELIRRRVGGMLVAADSIAEGDFEQRVPTGLVPDEVQDLALAYNRMAVKLGEAFGAMEESRRQIAAVVDSMAEGVVAFDAVGSVRVINPEAARLLGTGERAVLDSPAAR
jgi:two-component system, OmpR family, sensor histidine kinase VicK